MTHQATVRGIAVSVGPDGSGAPAVLLEVGDEFVPIFVDPGQARRIEQGRQGIPVERPMTHDLFLDVVEDLDGNLERVRVDAIEDETFYAKLDLTVDRGTGRERLVRDARPSDGIALAVRVDCPITIADDVLDEAGRDPDLLAEGPAETNPSGPLGAGMHNPHRTRRSDVDLDDTSGPIDLDEGVEIDIDDRDTPVTARDDDSGDDNADETTDTDRDPERDDSGDTESADDTE